MRNRRLRARQDLRLLLVGPSVAWLALGLTGCPAAKEIVKPTEPQGAARVIHPEQLHNQAVDALEAGKLERAEALVRRAIVENDRRSQPAALADAHYNLGTILLKTGRLEEARRAFQRVLSRDPKHRQALLNLGVALRRQKKHREAIEHYRQALKTVGRDPQMMNNLIALYRLSNNRRQAEKTGYRLLARAPSNVEAYKNMSLIYHDQGRYEMAELMCRKAINLLKERRKKVPSTREDAGIDNNLGVVYLAQKRYREALSQFERALQVDPEHVDALVNLGAVSHRFRDYARALGAYEKALSLEPAHPLALLGRAYAVYGMGDANKAIERFGEVLARRPNDGDILFKMGEIYNQQLRDYAKALSYYRRYKRAMGSRLTEDDPVHDRIRSTEAKLEMAEQLQSEGRTSAEQPEPDQADAESGSQDGANRARRRTR